MDEEIVSGGVEKEENGHTCQPEIRPAVFAAGWLPLFSLSNTRQGEKVRSCLPLPRDGNLVRQGGCYRGHGSGDRGQKMRFGPSEVSVGYYGAAQHVRAMRSET